jgi:hypothetical protein
LARRTLTPPRAAAPGVCAAFSVNPCKEGARAQRRAARGALQKAWQGGYAAVHAHSPAPDNLVMVPGEHALLATAVHRAFYEHCPLILSADVVWVTILQGLAQHCAQAGEDVRAAWGVTHEGKMKICVARKEDYLDGRSHDWPGVITEFSDKVGAVIGRERLALAECSFSTSSATDRVVSRVALLDCVQKFFELTFACGCGIPWIALRGTPADWRDLRARAKKLRAFGLDWWCDELEPLLDQFVAAAEGRPDRTFWESMCNLSGGSGIRMPISGWIQVLYPYLNTYEHSGVRAKVGAALERNAYLGEWRKEYAHAAKPGGSAGDMSTGFPEPGRSEPIGRNGGPPLGRSEPLFGRNCGRGVALKDLPAGLSCAPFTMQHVPTGRKVPMAFLAGVAAVSQDDATHALELHTGWAVAQRRPEPPAGTQEEKPPARKKKRGGE